MLKYRLFGALVFVAIFAVPVGISLATESPGGAPHTTEWHGKYEGCKWTNGWARRTWDLMDRNLPGPERDPNYSYPGRNGKLYDFRCVKPPVKTVTATATVTAPGGTVTVPGPTVTAPGTTSTVTVPGPTVTQTSTVTATVTVTPSPDPELDDICHATGQGGYVLISPADQGVLEGHLGHEDDIIPAPAEGCPEEES